MAKKLLGSRRRYADGRRARMRLAKLAHRHLACTKNLHHQYLRPRRLRPVPQPDPVNVPTKFEIGIAHTRARMNRSSIRGLGGLDGLRIGRGAH